MTELTDTLGALLADPANPALHHAVADRLSEEYADDPRGALLALCRAHPESDGPRLALATWLEAQGSVRVTCPKCKGRKKVTLHAAGIPSNLCPKGKCPTCKGKGAVLDTSNCDRAELIRVQCELEMRQLGPNSTWKGDETDYCWGCFARDRKGYENAAKQYGCKCTGIVRRLFDRESALLAANPDWLPPCPCCVSQGKPPVLDRPGEPACTWCGGSGCVGRFERGLAVVSVLELGAVRERMTCKRCNGTRRVADTEQMRRDSATGKRPMIPPSKPCTTCRDGLRDDYTLTPYAAKLRAEYPFTVGVEAADRVPYWNGGAHCFYNSDRVRPVSEVPESAQLPPPVFAFIRKPGKTASDRLSGFASPDAATRACARAVARCVYDTQEGEPDRE